MPEDHTDLGRDADDEDEPDVVGEKADVESKKKRPDESAYDINIVFRKTPPAVEEPEHKEGYRDRVYKEFPVGACVECSAVDKKNRCHEPHYRDHKRADGDAPAHLSSVLRRRRAAAGIDQVVQSDTVKSTQFNEDTDVRHRVPALPSGDGFIRISQHLRKTGLGEATLLSQLGEICGNHASHIIHIYIILKNGDIVNVLLRFSLL